MWPLTITACVCIGYGEGVISRLNAGDFIDERRMSNYTPLIYAAYFNQCEMIELLLDKGADLEAVDKNGLSALRTAIHYRKEEAAILLARRGADANKIAYQQMTALHAAVKDSQLAVVRALLVNGADLTIKSVSKGKTAIDYVSGNNAVLKNLLMTFVNLRLAIEGKSCGAVCVLLKKTLSERTTIDDAVNAYKTAMTASYEAEGKWRVDLIKLVEQFEIAMLNCATHRGSTEFVDAVFDTTGKAQLISSIYLNSKSWNVLHVAASQGHLNLVNHLLTNYDCDSAALDSNGNKASDLVNAKEDETSKHIYWILSQHEKRAKFMDLCAQVMLQDESMRTDIHELPRYLTSIYDLRTLYCLAYGTLTTDEMKTLLDNAFAIAVQEKLMYDDTAAVFFQKVLDECHRLKLISTERKYHWEIQARHVNTENADWVREIQNMLVRLDYRVTITQKNISSLTQNYNMLRNALEENIRLDGERMRRRQLIGLVTGCMFFCGGHLIEGTINLAFDACESAEAIVTGLTEVSSETLSTKLGDAACKHVLMPRAKAILERACIDQTKFKDLLQEAVALEKADPSDLEAINHRCGTESTDSVEFPPHFPVQPRLRFRDVVLMVIARMNQEHWQKGISMLVDLSHLTDDVLMKYPYHYVVFHSLGDLNEFKERVKYVDPEAGDVDATMEIQVPENTGSLTPGNQSVGKSTLIRWKKIHATAATYASYMGYVDIVEWFLRSGPVSKTEEKFAQKKEQSYVLINRARNVHKRVQAPMIA